MRTARLSAHHHPVWMVVVFVAALVVSFFALGTVAGACDSRVVIHKTEIGAAAPGDSYTFVMTGDEFRREVVVDAGASTVISGVPPGTYWFEEVGAPSGATIEPNPITIESRSYDQQVDVYATNPYLAGRLAITKVTTGSTAPAGPYTFDIAGDGITLTATVEPGTTWTSDWLPLGTYTVTERNAPAGATITPNPVTLDTDGQTVTVTATNPYRDTHARLAITKVTTGSTAPAGPYTFDITGDGITLTATVEPGTTWTSDWLPLGTYTVTERNAPAGATITPNPVTLDTDGQIITVTATNPYRDAHAKLEIVKVLAGGGTDPAGPWTIDVTGPVSLTAQIATGATWTSDWLPLGTYTVTERNAPAGATITPNPVTLGTDGETVRVVVTNPAVESAAATTTTPPPTTTPRTLPATGGGTASGTVAPIALIVLMSGTALVGAVRIRTRRPA